MSSGIALASATDCTDGTRCSRSSSCGRELPRILVGRDRAAQVVGGEQQSFDAESGIGVLRLDEALEEQAGDDEHEQGEAALQRHQAVAHGAAARRLRAASERLLRIDASELQRRRGAEQQTAADAEDHREGEAERIEAGLEADRERAVRRHRSQRFGAPPRDQDADDRAEDAEQQVLGEHQPDHAAGPGAEREAHADFAIARAGAREHQVGGVAADREQHQQHHALQDAERGDEHHLRAARRLPVRHQLAADAAVAFRE